MARARTATSAGMRTATTSCGQVLQGTQWALVEAWVKAWVEAWAAAWEEEELHRWAMFGFREGMSCNSAHTTRTSRRMLMCLSSRSLDWF